MGKQARARVLKDKCVDGIEANLPGCERSAESTLAAATALNPYIGYDKATEIVKEAANSGRMLRDVAFQSSLRGPVRETPAGRLPNDPPYPAYALWPTLAA